MSNITSPNNNEKYVRIDAQPGETLASIDSREVETLYKQHGAILFRGFDLTVDTFKELTERFCNHSTINNTQNRQTVNQLETIQTVDGGDQPFPLHTEVSRAPWKPDVLWFACFKPPASGGNTLICDGLDIVNGMDDELLGALKGRQFAFKDTPSSKDLEFWFGTALPSDKELAQPPGNCPYSYQRVNGTIIRTYLTAAIHRPMFNDSDAFGGFLLFARYAVRTDKVPTFEDGSIVPQAIVDKIKLIGDHYSVPIQWQKHDFIMLDNTRFMHGRTSIDDESERLIITNFGYLHFATSRTGAISDQPWRDPANRAIFC